MNHYLSCNSSKPSRTALTASPLPPLPAAAAALMRPLVFCFPVGLCKKCSYGFTLTFKFHTHAQKEWTHSHKNNQPSLVALTFPRYLTPLRGLAQTLTHTHTPKPEKAQNWTALLNLMMKVENQIGEKF